MPSRCKGREFIFIGSRINIAFLYDNKYSLYYFIGLKKRQVYILRSFFEKSTAETQRRKEKIPLIGTDTFGMVIIYRELA